MNPSALRRAVSRQRSIPASARSAAVDSLCASANAMLAQMSDDEQREFWRDLDSVQADRFLLKESR